MREILFRAFQDNEMLIQPISGIYGMKRFLGLLYEDAIIEQYTGLKDKNGVKIFEGDILRYYTINMNEAKDESFNVEVYFCKGTAHSEWKCKKGRYHFSLCTNKIINAKLEVIGNIHE